MNKKSGIALIFFFCGLALLITSCGVKEGTETPSANPPADVQQPTEASAELASILGIISGVVGLQAPPTPPMILYAVDPISGEWYATETSQAEGEAAYQLEVAPGSYQVFAFAESGAYVGYSVNGMELSAVAVMAGQTVTDINLYPPGQSECGNLFSVPASPDGRFEATSDMCILPENFTPLDEAECSQIADELSMQYGLAAETSQASYTDPITQLTGTSCLIVLEGSAVQFENLANVHTTITQVLNRLTFIEDTALGQGDGPTGFMIGFRQGNKTCRVLAEWVPAEDANCPTDQPITACDLTPEQMLYTLTLNCVEEPLDSVALPKTEPERIKFAAGATSARIEKTLSAGELQPYVLGIMAGQQLSVFLAPAGTAALKIWGVDGAMLVTADVGYSSWVGTVPLSQDYYIDVISLSSETVNYAMEVTIPAVAQAFPEIQPFETDMMQRLAASGVPLILPPNFTAEAGLPGIFPYILSINPGEFEISLDYGTDCQGGGACHFGVIAAYPASGSIPAGSENYPFDLSIARRISLAKGITGYFTDYTCGANCGDALIYWVYQGYEYVIGLKAGTQEKLIALVNVAIENSIPD